MGKKQKSIPPPTARPKTVERLVEHPSLGFIMERVDYVRSPVDRLKGRQKLDAFQVMAAEKYRSAWEALQGSPGGAMDFDRVRGAGTPGSPPTLALLNAGTVLAEATETLGRHVLVIEASIGYGYSVVETAKLMLGEKRGDIEFIGQLIRMCLTMLAQRWYQVGPEWQLRKPMLRLHRPDDAIPREAKEGVIEPGGTAHASARKVHRRPVST